MRARIAAHSLHVQHDSRKLTAPARKALSESFERKVDPDGVLDARERRRRAEHARKAHYTAMALKSAQVRRQRKAGTGRAERTVGLSKGPSNPPRYQLLCQAERHEGRLGRRSHALLGGDDTSCRRGLTHCRRSL